jgi:dinuclear metal center YbgI/SA1388 family protein
MRISEIIQHLESVAPVNLQESYDNAGLISGNAGWNCSGILITLDATEKVIEEAIKRNCNLVVAHHPILFRGIKRLTGTDYVQKALITAIKNDIAIYAIHTNLDNVLAGVSGKMASVLGLKNISILSAKDDVLEKLYTFVPVENAEQVRQAIFSAGAGRIGNYYDCSFNAEGVGTFTAGEGTDPHIGEIGKPAKANEIKVEVIFPSPLRKRIIKALIEAHPYEEVAYDVVRLQTQHPQIGSGVLGELESPMDELNFLSFVKKRFNLQLVRYTPLLNKPIKRVALCGGSGSFLISRALAAEADVFMTADVKYHEFFDANDRLVIADIGHFESEQFTIDLLQEILAKKFPTFAVLKSGVKTNPVNYYF